MSSLVRNNKQIREDRALAIGESAEMFYARQIQDMKMKIKQMKRERESMLDLSRTSTTSLVVASDFKPEDFVKKDIEMGVDIRNLEITLGIAEERYNYLFKE